MQIIKSIQSRIYVIRGERVMLDFDLASLYEVETKVLNQAVKRNILRFPEDFMFQLTKEEWNNLRFQFETSNETTQSSQIVMMNRSQFVTGSQKHRDNLPYAFTEQGVAMLSGVLRSERAINMNIAIMRAFVDVRKILLKQSNINEQILEIKERLGEHDVQLNELYDAMDNMLDEKIAQLKWKDRERIGFKMKE
ncbi:ORF6N domain-containing protein [Pedobacter fastidiosus]|uniref:ORF6N domain-containing protein n=1 Tax=Pedobacter fastidiosus TaxID=2765361 RepID=A0ABR7KNR3_9SPHI|nr:ORF6N domain-containing protein [Pedobacter fastidiosus]MBC6109729.1 ORF6N domain-containing protein [Pedobacter fastidiosus]